MREGQEILPPRTRIGDFEILRVLGRGASAITYFARDVRVEGRKVAIKEFFPSRFVYRTTRGAVELRNPEARKSYEVLANRFRDEGQLLGRLDHPNLGSAQKSIEANGSIYHVMKYETGTSLRNFLRASRSELPIHARKIRDLARGLLDGLEYLHVSGFLHCDIKPSNIFIGSDWNPVIIDMGSALAFDTGGVLSRESIEWTDHYAPGELLRTDAVEIGPWTDIYSLGAVLYRCVSGGKIPKTEDRLREFDPYLSLSELAPMALGKKFYNAVDRALERLPADRPKSVGEFRQDLGVERNFEDGLCMTKDLFSDIIMKGISRVKEGVAMVQNRLKL